MIRKHFRPVESLSHLDAYTRAKDATVEGRLFMVKRDMQGMTSIETPAIHGVYRTEQMDDVDTLVSFTPDSEEPRGGRSILITNELIAVGAVEVLARMKHSAPTEIA